MHGNGLAASTVRHRLCGHLRGKGHVVPSLVLDPASEHCWCLGHAAVKSATTGGNEL